MFKSTVLSLLGLISIFICIKFVFKNFLINFNGSDHDSINAFIILIIIIICSCSLYVVGQSITLKNMLFYFDTFSANSHIDNSIITGVFNQINRLVIPIAVSYVLYLPVFIIMNHIKKEKLKDYERNRGTHWDLQKFIN